MLQQIDFYSFKSFAISDTMSVQAELELNPLHAIFKGHFPENPVVPGVCLIQVSKEITEKAVGFALVLTQSSQVKFLAVVDPTINKFLQVTLDIKEQENGISVLSTIFSGDKIFFKFKGSFRQNQV